MKPSAAMMLAGITVALAACNSADQNRTTSTPPGVHNPTALNEPVGRSAPAAPPERGPVPANANAAAPGTNATVAFNSPDEEFIPKGLPSKGGAPQSQAQAVTAQADAAKAPDTAAADAAKKKAMSNGESGLRMSGTARDTAANSPRHGTVTPAEESTQMPKAGQVNNYSSPALEKDSGRPSTGDQSSSTAK